MEIIVDRDMIELVDCCFFFNDTATTEIYTLSLHDALPIYGALLREWLPGQLLSDAILRGEAAPDALELAGAADRKSTRLNSSHANISYAVFCLKKKYTHPPYKNASHVRLCVFSQRFFYSVC